MYCVYGNSSRYIHGGPLFGGGLLLGGSVIGGSTVIHAYNRPPGVEYATRGSSEILSVVGRESICWREKSAL